MLEWKWQRSTLGMGSRCPPVTWRGRGGGGGRRGGVLSDFMIQIQSYSSLWEFSVGMGGGATFVTEIQSMRTLKLIPPLASVNLNSRSLSHDRICQPKYVCSSTICPPSPIFWNNIARAFPVTRFRSQDGCTTMYDVLAILRDSERTYGRVEF